MTSLKWRKILIIADSHHIFSLLQQSYIDSRLRHCLVSVQHIFSIN